MRNRRKLKNEINVVPYIDVMLVLLVIFMVTAPMMPTGNIDLPTVGQAATPPVAPIEVSVRADQTLAIVNRGGNGQEQSVTLDQLTDQLLTMQKGNPDTPVLIAGAKTVPYEAVLQVMDQLQKAQIKRVGLLVSPTGK
ncbi:MAG: protein TolR [Rhodocyclaceae bacterium]|jgi:biopolymer transport protein TolR|uniref:Protein TolR n=2 Tax=Fluviibacter phosphoraccumulans TaxID=1751046 RepID=A0A679I6Q6_9RHOO|nr:protein TolR [Fluviibacter phosphoraccumulans]MBP7991647.1 protein TolR [Rhodocyclaceae bacterium]BBU68509.1 protein TolR [Fluviibacter phosphoraccumulans]BBU72336.1 protein TolR [Fluviibacter phosphoraccumulans]BCA64422.1 protein TolR [Fluviibacter phosphoraccumulans]